MSEGNKEKIESRTKNMGPCGLGDPDDRSLRKIEKDVLVEKMMRDIARTEKCVKETEAFEKCGREQRWRGVFNCRDENDKMYECMGKWYHNKEFREEVTEMYLKERSDYRRTGISKQFKTEIEKKGYEIRMKS